MFSGWVKNLTVLCIIIGSLLLLCVNVEPLEKQFGFDIALDDADIENSRKVQMIWAGTKDNHMSPEKYGLVIIK